MKYSLLIMLMVLGGCTGTTTCAAIDAAHEVFLAEVEANPTRFTKKEISNERLAYAAARAACTSFVVKSPVTK